MTLNSFTTPVSGKLHKPQARLWASIALAVSMGCVFLLPNQAESTVSGSLKPPAAVVSKAPSNVLLQSVDMAPEGLEDGPTLPKTGDETAYVAIVPLKTNSQALMVDATLNRSVSGTFVVDTGATYTSISREMAKALNLDLVNCDHILITTANGRIEVPKVIIKRLRVNGLEAENVETTVIDIHRGASFSGLLGLSFIKQFKLTIDAQAGQLIFRRGS